MTPAGNSSCVIPLDKPVGPTSHDMVDRARRALGKKRIGHTGTLDPFASGLLLLCVGGATRLSEFLVGLDKTYEAVARLGAATDTEDLDGEVVSASEAWRDVDGDALAAALDALRGPIDQVPPQFSAKKVGGEAMHRRARRGEHVELPPRRVQIHEIEVLDVTLPDLRFRVRCSSGTYVRSLARDLGEHLGVGAHLIGLRRTAVGGFTVDGALDVDDLDSPRSVEAVCIHPLAALEHLPCVQVDARDARAIAHGRRVPVPGAVHSSTPGPIAVAHEGDLVAVGVVEDGLLRPRKVFLGV